MRTYIVAPLLLALAACAGAEDVTADSTANLEESAGSSVIPGMLASCSVSTTDVTTVTCNDASAALPTKFLVTVSVTGADGTQKGFDLVSAATGSTRLLTTFPLTVEVHATPKAGPSSAGLPFTEITQKLTVAGPTDALAVRLPYDFWPVTLSGAGTVVVPARTIDVAPWSAVAGSTLTLPEVALQAPGKGVLAVAAGTKSVDAKVQGAGFAAAGAFDGPGAFTVGSRGVERAGSAPAAAPAEPTAFGEHAETFLACHLGARTAAGAPVWCSARDVGGPQRLLLDARLEGANVTASPVVSGDTLVGTCASAPCIVSGTVAFALGGAGTTNPFTYSMSLDAGPATLRTPFDLLTATIDARGLRLVSVTARDVAAGTVPAGWTTANDAVFAQPVSNGVYTYVVPVGTTSLPVHVVGLDLVARKKVEADAVLAQGGAYAVQPDFTLASAQ